MSINLPGYGTAGWGATLNNYLRSLEKRLNVIEGKVSSNSEVKEQILAVSRYAGSGLTSTSTTITQKNKDDEVVVETVTGTIPLTNGDKLIFENLSYYIQASLTNDGGAYITFNTSQEWTYAPKSTEPAWSTEITTNQTSILCIDEEGNFAELPKILSGQITDTSSTNLNFCRLGYITKIGSSVFFTPAPEIASINAFGKFEFWSNPKIKTEQQNSNKDTVNKFTFCAEGLGYCQNASNFNNILINDFDILNSLKYETIDGYYTINSSGLQNSGTISGFKDVDGDGEGSIAWVGNKTIRAYYVTLTGKVFCYIHTLTNTETMPITSQELGAYQIPRNGSDEDPHPLFDNYAFICPVEVFRLAKNEYGAVISYSNTYNGFPPQLHNTPVFGSNNAVKWSQFHFMQDNNATGSNSSTYNTLSIRPIVNTNTELDAEPKNLFITVDMTDSTETINNEILLTSHKYKKQLNIESSNDITITSQKKLRLTSNNIIGLEADKIQIYDSSSVIVEDDECQYLCLNPYQNSLLIGTTMYFSEYNSTELSKNNNYICYGESQQSAKKALQLHGDNIEFNTTGSGHIDIFSASTTFWGQTTIRNNLDVTGAVTWTSDRNLKTNITPMIFNSTEFINSIPLYNYALKTTPNNQTIGLMAQDLQQHLPQLVHEAQDGHLTIEETKLVYICMDALKQANQRIELLEGKVNDLCNKISQYHL